MVILTEYQDFPKFTHNDIKKRLYFILYLVFFLCTFDQEENRKLLIRVSFSCPPYLDKSSIHTVPRAPPNVGLQSQEQIWMMGMITVQDTRTCISWLNLDYCSKHYNLYFGTICEQIIIVCKCNH